MTKPTTQDVTITYSTTPSKPEINSAVKRIIKITHAQHYPTIQLSRITSVVTTEATAIRPSTSESMPTQEVASSMMNGFL